MSVYCSSTTHKLKAALAEKISSTDFEKARLHVVPFISDATKLDIWSPDYFTQVAVQMKIALGK